MKILTWALQNFGIGILNSYLSFGYLTLFCSIKKISTLHPIAESDSNVDPSDSVKWNLLIAESDSNVDNLSRWKSVFFNNNSSRVANKSCPASLPNAQYPAKFVLKN